MENLNAEQIKKEIALFIDDMPLRLHLCERKTIKFCAFLKNVLDLIKSQEQEIEVLHRLVGEKIQEKVMLAAENEKIGIENFDLVCELSRIKEDTVRKMQERLRDRHLTATNPNVICLYETELDQIAKEMLEGIKCQDEQR